jgi:hypothetical protein
VAYPFIAFKAQSADRLHPPAQPILVAKPPAGPENFSRTCIRQTLWPRNARADLARRLNPLAPGLTARSGAGGGAPKGNRNALKHGDFTAETLAL